MAERRIFICDLCGQEQRQDNHWFESKVIGEALILAPMGKMPWQDAGTAVQHLCGEGCTMRRLSEFLGAVLSENQVAHRRGEGV
jgi:hypothetical protein